jgi:hypothetical protein
VSPVSLPVLGGAAVVSSPALWRALVEGTTSTEVALTRYLVSVLVCWAVLGLVAMLVGPAPKPEPEPDPESEYDEAGEVPQEAEVPAPVT